MKKEALVFVLLITLFFVLGAGCVQQEQDIDFSNAQALIDWSESFPDYYYSNSVDPEFQAQVDLALETQNREDCQQILLIGGEEAEVTEERIDILYKCYDLLTKKKAFFQKNIKECDSLYNSENTMKYEECAAPIAAFFAITNNDKSLCNANLNNKELITICEDDYERFI